MTQSTANQIYRSETRPDFVRWLSYYAIFGCFVFAVSILIADFVVPNHDWIADTISDLGAGKYEFIVDIGIYAFSASLLAVALCAAHLHVGGGRWSLGCVGLAILALLVFLIGARNEYGDNDSDGAVIHIYLVYALGIMMTLIPWLMSGGAYQIRKAYGTALVVISILWTVSAPVFFWLPDSVDGIYERYLGLIAFALVATLSALYLEAVRRD